MPVRKTLLLLLCTCLMLPGCVGTVVVGTTAMATKIAIDPRTLGTQVDDYTLKARVANALAKDKQLKKEARVINTTYQSKVLLTGQAPTIALAERAKQITKDVDGTTVIYNEIRQGKPVSLVRALIDIWITIKIRSQLLAHEAVKSSNVKVTTENGEVFLFGLVTHAEGKTAAEIASRVSGVKHVIIAFTYRQ
ncbi:osmotically-inducible protein OsmY [Candidatus Palibaumannia cicadellinicola]|uniref:Osmotically-inducible protein OsmY n=1 Tax=Candidatus Palibaumannia cicadellinicola TaxID=186490 RepID=A0A2N4XWL4_9GAMM|nr:division/outer membrane stress-associated lipid-binding lipoprotein [Candidatus Baumannia cicadellinicola]PLK58416.1 osmotically-inducible protein OsmY [Candidatus Baumannia cicadellinicola]